MEFIYGWETKMGSYGGGYKLNVQYYKQNTDNINTKYLIYLKQTNYRLNVI